MCIVCVCKYIYRASKMPPFDINIYIFSSMNVHKVNTFCFFLFIVYVAAHL